MKQILTVAALGAAALPALAGTTTQTLDFTWDGLGEWQVGAFQGFDDMGGSRQLTGVTVEVAAFARWDVIAQNYSPTPFEPDEWFAEGSTNFNVLLGEFGGDSAERVVGSIFFTYLTGALGAGDDDPFIGQPGDPAVQATFEGDIAGSFDLDLDEFGVFQNAEVAARLLSFTDAWVDGPNGAPGTIFIGTEALTATGSMTLTYHYVPTPAGVALLGVLAPVAIRRRR